MRIGGPVAQLGGPVVKCSLVTCGIDTRGIRYDLVSSTWTYWEIENCFADRSIYYEIQPTYDENRKSYGYESHLYQKAWNGHLVIFVFSSKGIPAPLNIPIPTPAPDQGLGPIRPGFGPY